MTLSNPVVNYNDNIVLSGKANMRNLPWKKEEVS
jgi:hypothetical protein